VLETDHYNVQAEIVVTEQATWGERNDERERHNEEYSCLEHPPLLCVHGAQGLWLRAVCSSLGDLSATAARLEPLPGGAHRCHLLCGRGLRRGAHRHRRRPVRAKDVNACWCRPDEPGRSGLDVCSALATHHRRVRGHGRGHHLPLGRRGCVLL